MNADLGMAERAAAWLSAVQQEGSDSKHEAFATWLRESPRHVEEFLFASAVEQALRGFDRGESIDIDAIVRGAPANVVPLKEAATSTARQGLVAIGKTNRRKWAIAAGLVAAVVGWMMFDAYSADHYATAIGEQRTIDLGDGSLLYLNTQSRVRVRFTARGRDVELTQGEALFEVAQDPTRPFRVHTSDAVIQVLGTQFNVYQRPGETRVSVLEGRVRVKHDKTHTGQAELVAGEDVRVAAGHELTKHMNPDIAQSIAWRQRRLVFKASTLEDIAVEFNRYNRSPRVRIEGNAIGQLRFTGVFDAGDPRSLGLLLDKDPELRFEARKGELVIRRR